MAEAAGGASESDAAGRFLPTPGRRRSRAALLRNDVHHRSAVFGAASDGRHGTARAGFSGDDAAANDPGKRSGSEEWADSEFEPFSEPEREYEPVESQTWRQPTSALLGGPEARKHVRRIRALDASAHNAAAAPPLKKSFCPGFVLDSLLAGVVWLARLNGEYGPRLLLLLFASQHMLKGVVQQFQASSVMWLLREYRISGPQMQVYVSISNSAWALKPIIGMISDLFPVFGYRKAPYVILTSIIGVVCTTTIGLSSKQATTVGSVVICLFGMQLQASTSDLLTEATYSERIQQKPHLGPDLIAYVWGGITLGNMVAISFVSALISTFGPRAVFLACIVPCAVVLYPTLMNYFDEVAYTRHRLAKVRAAFLQQREVLFLCVLMTFLTIVLTITGTCTRDHRLQFYCALAILLTLVAFTNLLLRPEIARINSFFMLQAALSVNINGATFYFYTDSPDQYPEGPHFTPWFFTTALGLVASVMSLVGLASYTCYMKDWSYRSLLLLSNGLVTILASVDIAMFCRLNVQWGISDRLFVIGSSVSTVVIRQWQWMPGVVVMSQLCPTGMEATMFALLAGCMNLGNQIADFLGAYLLSVLEVHPTGAAHESHQFNNLWKASCAATLLPGVTIALIPLLVPRHRQTEKLLFHNANSATAGSPWSNWFGGAEEESDEGHALAGSGTASSSSTSNPVGRSSSEGGTGHRRTFSDRVMRV